MVFTQLFIITFETENIVQYFLQYISRYENVQCCSIGTTPKDKNISLSSSRGLDWHCSLGLCVSLIQYCEKMDPSRPSRRIILADG